MAVIAYIRKSTDKQSFEHQEFEINEYTDGLKKVFQAEGNSKKEN